MLYELAKLYSKYLPIRSIYIVQAAYKNAIELLILQNSTNMDVSKFKLVLCSSTKVITDQIISADFRCIKK